MPQMAPTFWLILFLLFLLMFYILMNMIYFSFIKSNNMMIMNYLKLKLKNYNKLI